MKKSLEKEIKKKSFSDLRTLDNFQITGNTAIVVWPYVGKRNTAYITQLFAT